MPKDEEKEEHVVRLLPKMERQMAVVRCALVQVWMMKETMMIIGATQDVSRDFAHQQAQIPDPAKKESELGPLHIRILERWIVELQKHYEQAKEHDPSVQADKALADLQTYVDWTADKTYADLADQLPVLKLARAWNKGVVKVEVTIDLHSETGHVWKNWTVPFLFRIGGRRQISVEPKGDLARRLQSWMDAKDQAKGPRR